MRRLLAVVLLATVGLVGCGSDPWVGEGTVVARSHDDADMVWVPGHTIDGGQTCTGGYGSQPRVCHDNPDTRIPDQWIRDPARWVLTVEDGEAKRHNLSVDPTTYEQCHEGAKWMESRCQR